MESEFSPKFQARVLRLLRSEGMVTVLSYFYSAQESQKTGAQRFIKCCKKHHPDALFVSLAFLIRGSPKVETRLKAARILRFVQISDLWPKLPEVEKERLKVQFLLHLQEENSMPVLRMVCAVVAETMSAIYKGGKQWSELLDFLRNYIGKRDDKSQETYLAVLAHLPRGCRSYIAHALSHNIKDLQFSLMWALGSANQDVQTVSFWAVLSLRNLFSHPSNRTCFNYLFNAMMIATSILVKKLQYCCAKRAIQALILLVSEDPQLLKPYVSVLVSRMLPIAEASVMAAEIIFLSIHLVMIMTTLRDLKPIFLNLPRETLRRLISIVIRMFACIEEGMVWKELKGEGDTDMNFYNFGIRCLCQLSICLGGSKIVPVASEFLPFYFDSPEWRQRYAGIRMLAVVTKGVSDETIRIVSFEREVVAKILRLFQDKHFQVRLATFKFMKQPTWFIQQMHIIYHHSLVTAFVTAVDDQNVNVKEEAASAMLLFLKNTLPKNLIMHTDVDATMTKVRALFPGNATNKQRFIALSTFNVVGQWCQEVAIKHYVHFLPVLLEACNEMSSGVKMEAVRGFRICAEFKTPEFLHYIDRILSELNFLIERSNRSLLENVKAHDIAVSALGRICMFHRDSIDASKLVPDWLSNLPLEDDLVEAKIMHDQLCVMVARSDEELLGSRNQNLYKIVEVFLQVIERGEILATAETIQQMGNQLRRIWLQFPSYTLNAIWSSLNAQHQDLILSLLSS